METLPNNGAQPPAPPAGPPAPVVPAQPSMPAPAPVYTQPPMQPGQPPMYQQGGMLAALKTINWVEFGFMVLGTLAILQIGHYYRHKLIKDKADNKAMQKQIDELENKILASKNNASSKKGVDFGIGLFGN